MLLCPIASSAEHCSQSSRRLLSLQCQSCCADATPRTCKGHGSECRATWSCRQSILMAQLLRGCGGGGGAAKFVMAPPEEDCSPVAAELDRRLQSTMQVPGRSAAVQDCSASIAAATRGSRLGLEVGAERDWKMVSRSLHPMMSTHCSSREVNFSSRYSTQTP